MASRFSTEGLAGSSARHPWRVVSIWLLILIAASVLSATSLGDALTPDISIDTDAEPVEGLDRLESSGLSDAAPIMETVVISSTDGTTIDDPAFQQRVTQVTDEIRRLQQDWTAVNGVTYPEVANVYELTQLGRPEADLVVSESRTSTIIPIGFPVNEPASSEVDELIDVLASFSDGAFAVGTIGTIGTLSINSEFTHTAEEDLVRGESIGIPVALLILIAVFGALLAPIIEFWIPILLFSILFGLSMDYHVFLLSRIREHYDMTARNRESVAVGLRSTARIITGAALIMVVVFGGFAAGSLVAFQQVGFGLGVAVLIDATIIRSILVPATMALLGNANWYLPRWLHWLPDLRVEGTPPTPAPPAPSGASAD